MSDPAVQTEVAQPDPVTVEVPIENVVPVPEVGSVLERPVVQRPRVVPVFLREDFPEIEAA